MTTNFPLGCLESPVDLRDYNYDMITTASKSSLPTKFKLEYTYPVLSQGSVGSCVAHSLSVLKSFIDGVDTSSMYSVGFIYANREEDDHQGTGMVTREALKNLVKYGDCYTSEFPINEEYPSILTTLSRYGKDKLYSSAKNHKSTAYIRLYTEDVKEYLVNQGKPILISVRVYSNFYNSQYNGGKIPSEPSGTYSGGHSMLCIGYDGDTLILVNSWGAYYGDNGLVYLNINSPIIKEYWALEDKKNLIIPPKVTYTVGWNKVVINNSTKWTYSNDGSTLLSESWIRPNGTKWYYLGKDNYAYENKWLLHKSEYYYFDKDTCEMATDKWIKWTDGYWYRLGSDGAMLRNKWYLDSDNKWYYLKDDGVMIANQDYNINGKFYHFDLSGAMDKKY